MILPVAVLLGGILGAAGATTNRVQTWDERLLWVLGGAIGAVPAAYLYALAAGAGLGTGLALYAGTGFLGVTLPPRLDATSSRRRWALSLAIKWARSPITTTFGLLAALVIRLTGRRTDFRAGMLFIPAGAGYSVLTLGAVGWAQNGCFVNGRLNTPLARHEALHGRTVAALGELGFYFTYLAIAAPWAIQQGAEWNDLTEEGLGNPFEKTAHTYTGDPPVAVAARRRLPA